MTMEQKAELILQITEEIEYRQEGLKLEDPMMMVGNNIYFSMSDLVEILQLVKAADVKGGDSE